MSKSTWVIVAITGVTALTAIADAFFKVASEREQPLLNSWFALGFVHYAASAFGVVYLMRHIKLTSFGIVYAVVDVVLLALIGVLVFRERLTTTEWVGVGLGLGLIQMKCEESPTANLEKARSMILEAARSGANIICLPELFLSQYFCQKPDNQSAFQLAEPIPGQTCSILSQLAKDCGIVLIGGSIFEREENQFYSSSPVFDATGELLGKYRKIHLPNDPLYYEKQYLAAGNLGVPVFDTAFGKISVLICYDQWFPETARIAALRGAEILFYPSAIGHFTDEEPIEGEWKTPWVDIQRSHAIANNIYVAAVNRVGIEDKLDFWGGSFICDAFGKVLNEGGGKEGIVLAGINLKMVKEIQELWGFFKNREPSKYETLIESASILKS